MGKALIIKGANFVTNAIDQAIPSPITKLIDFEGSFAGSMVPYNVDLVSTNAPDWVAFAQFAWQGGRSGEVRLFNFFNTDTIIQVGYTNNNQYYKAAGRTDYSSTVIHNFDNSIRKIGFKKQNNHVYVSFNGLSWEQTEFTPTSEAGAVSIWGVTAAQAVISTYLRLTVWDDPEYDISYLFND